jgi:hypothetical protein
MSLKLDYSQIELDELLTPTICKISKPSTPTTSSKFTLATPTSPVNKVPLRFADRFSTSKIVKK